MHKCPDSLIVEQTKKEVNKIKNEAVGAIKHRKRFKSHFLQFTLGLAAL